MTPLISIQCENSPVITRPQGYPVSFYRIEVKNLSQRPIERCFAQIKQFGLVSKEDPGIINNVSFVPKEGHDLPWSEISGGKFEHDLGAGETGYIDYIKTLMHSSFFTVPTRSNTSDGKPAYNAFRIPAGNYDITISVGSKADTIEPQTIRFRFNYNGRTATVTKPSGAANKDCIS